MATKQKTKRNRNSEDELHLNGTTAKFLQEFGALQQSVKEIGVKLDNHLTKSDEVVEQVTNQGIYWRITFWLIGSGTLVGLITGAIHLFKMYLGG